jgi:non-ribosomal peptide synthetase component F
MASRSTGTEAELVPSEKPSGASYDRDFYGWALEQARLLRAGHWDVVDRDNVAEEIESFGREQFNKLESAFRVLMLHMLNWDHQPALRSRSWVLSIETQRVELDDVLAGNPGLKPRIAEAIARLP